MEDTVPPVHRRGRIHLNHKRTKETLTDPWVSLDFLE